MAFKIFVVLVLLFITGAISEDELKTLKQHLNAVTQHVMLQQFYNEQRVRSEGQSGIHLQRLRRGGTKNYFGETHSGYAAAAVHDHANNIRTVGMGEFSAVLNGLEFTTRHNDYRLYMPHRSSREYHATEPIPFPDVPPEVLDKSSVQEQIDEMREWFKAWRDQKFEVRDYRKYFKPILCYLEGAWTKAETKVDEPFSSDRHFIDAKTWMDLHKTVMFTSYTGSKSIRENFSFLPTKIIEMVNDTIPLFAQWNYRILCHPLKKHLPLSRLRVVEDLSSRMMSQRDIYKQKHSRAARFQLNSKDSVKFHDRPVNYELIDDLMSEIPGKDNYQGVLYDEGLEAEVLNYNGSKKDVSRYHRWYKTEARDAMGTTNIHRGYNDHMLFAAMTTQSKVAGLSAKKCKNRRYPKTCRNIHQKWTYAIPLEIIYLTPLSKWNPYKLKYYGNHNKYSPVNRNGRRGSCKNDANLEFNGTNSKMYYRTPAEFYTGDQIGKTSADTSRGTVCVLDSENNVHKVRASGTHVFLPNIKDVGVLRQRYPIFPVHGEGSSVWKEVSALREMFMDMKRWNYMKWTYGNINPSAEQNNTELEMSPSEHAKVTQHTHTVELSAAEASQCKGGIRIFKTTSTSNGHEHILRIKYIASQQKYVYDICDNASRCWDKHGINLFVVNNDDQVSL